MLNPRIRSNAFQAGATVLVFGNDLGFSDKTRALLDRLTGLGVNSVGLAFPLFQDSWTANDVRVDPLKTPSPGNIALFVKEAHRRGFTVMLRPILDEQSLLPDARWRGAISPSDPHRWFASYDAVLLDYARFASANRVEILDVGTELTSMQPFVAEWQALIAQVRPIYSGQLTYSANWSEPSVPFGSSLDFVGIDAFFPLDAAANESVAQLVTAWQAWLPKVGALARETGKPIVVTELGTTAENASYQHPWLWSQGTGLNLDDQAHYYAAACQALKSRVSGMYWWEFELEPRGPSDPSFVPMNKPAEQQIALCFR